MAQTEKLRVYFKDQGSPIEAQRPLQINVVKGTILPIPYSSSMKITDAEGQQFIINLLEIAYLKQG